MKQKSIPRTLIVNLPSLGTPCTVTTGKKGGGGILVFVSRSLPCKRLKLDRTYKTLEPLAIEVKIGTKDWISAGIYRPPKPVTRGYQIQLEVEMTNICTRASLRRGSAAFLGDLNLERLRPDKSEDTELILDLEVEQDLKCLINDATRIERRGQTTTNTLIDVLLTNRPELFKSSGTYQPSLSDHALIYGVMKKKLQLQTSRITNFRSYKNFDCDKFKKDLSEAPWHVGEIFNDLEDQTHYWSTLMSDVIEENLPSKKMRVRAKDVPCMTTSWKNAIRAKRKALAKFHDNKSDSNWENLGKCRNEAVR